MINNVDTEVNGKKALPRDISAIMRRVRGANTGVEIAFRKRLWARGIRYRICVRDLPGKPDIVISRHRLAVFVDGDFWHGGQWRKRRLAALDEQFGATRSRDYWLKKIRKNMQRDSIVTAELLERGWTVLRFWESQISKNLEECADMVVATIERGVEPGPVSLAPQKTFAEFFAGIGLMRMGLERQGWTLAMANDIDKEKYETYAGNYPDAADHFVLGDVHHLPEERVPTVSLATASFPCNDLSLAGARGGLSGKQSSAFWGFIDVIERMAGRKPPLILLENVPGFLTSRGGKDFKDAALALNRLGYSVDAIMVDAARFVPQSRLRLFVIGILDSASPPDKVREQRKFFEDEVRPPALADYILLHSEIRWRVRNLPPPPQRNTRLADMLEDLPADAPEWWNEQRTEYLLNQMSARHRTIAERMISSPEISFGAVFRRVRKGGSMAELRTDGLAGCLRTPRGGSGRQILFCAGAGKRRARLLTPRECARLMGADEYRITVPQNQALFGFGDAVCVPVIEWIAESYLNPVLNEILRGRPMTTYAGTTQ